MHPEGPDDRYFDDGVHYVLSVEQKILVTEAMLEEGGRGGHAVHGEWWWRDSVPEDVVVDPFYLSQD